MVLLALATGSGGDGVPGDLVRLPESQDVGRFHPGAGQAWNAADAVPPGSERTHPDRGWRTPRHEQGRVVRS